MKHLFLCLSVFLVFTSCKKSENQPKSLAADAEITQKLKEFYGIYGKSSDVIYDRPIPKNLFSSDLEKTFQEAIDVSNADAEKVKKSAHPTDKPALLEGSIFTGLYEGFTTYKVKSIDVKENNQNATVTVDFENANFQNTKWTDTVKLVNFSDSGWRVDNITFSEKLSGTKDVKTSLKNFISGTKK